MTTEHQLGDAPIELKYRDEMNQLARALDLAFNGKAVGSFARTGIDERKTGFVLLSFPMNELDTRGGKSRCNFISNGAARQDIVALFKEMIARFEGAPDAEGHA